MFGGDIEAAAGCVEATDEGPAILMSDDLSDADGAAVASVGMKSPAGRDDVRDGAIWFMSSRGVGGTAEESTPSSSKPSASP